MALEQDTQVNAIVVGGGAREDTIGKALRQSPNLRDLYFAPGNAGTERWGRNLNITASNVPLLNQAVLKNNIDLVVVGPEDPLFLGLADTVRQEGKLVYGHSQEASEIERSKKFGMQVAAQAGVPHAYSEFAHSASEGHRLINEWSYGEGIVVKADGPALGKGVVVTESRDEAHEVLEDMMVREKFGEAGKIVVLQQKLVGPELSVQAAVRGRLVRMFPFSRDEKRAFDGRRGPNTGGMGAMSPIELSPALKRYIRNRIVVPIAHEMAKMGRPLSGTLYPGLILTADGPRVVEFNNRFGDPETQVVLPRTEEDVLGILFDTAQGSLQPGAVRESKDAAVNTVIASRGYPGDYQTGFEINSEILAGGKDVTIFVAGAKKTEDGKTRTSGGRVLSIMTRGATVQEAAEKGQAWIKGREFGFPEHHRTDIGLIDDHT